MSQIRLEFEALEDRSVPSGTTGFGSVGASLFAQVGPLPAVHPAVHPLAGHGNGMYSTGSLVVDAGMSYHFSGNGHFGLVGDAKISGTIQGVGMIASGKAGGSITFTNSHGSVTIAVEGPMQASFSAIPKWYSYHVVSGSGSYQNLHDKGTLRIDLTPSPIVQPLYTPPVGVIPGSMAGSYRISI